jgi:LysR family transcriptional regulator, glycine cleavage system transcriptional activator
LLFASRTAQYPLYDTRKVMPMSRRLPPLNALRAFEAAARNENFSHAAIELGVSQAAVSQHVKSLEAAFGLKLFARDGKRLVITSAGREYLAVVRDALDRIAVGTDRLLQHRPSSVLVVSTSPDFGAKWLVHRLGRFTAVHPEIDLRVASTTKQVDLIAEQVDLAVRHGDGHWAGLDAVALCPERLVPVCSPKLLSTHDHIAQASDLLTYPLLRLDGWTTWCKWFEAAGVSASPRGGPVLNQASMLIDAAIDGQGVALARTTLAAWDLLHGRLVIPIDISLPLENTYWIVYPKLASREPRILALRDWFLAEAAEEERRLRTLIKRGFRGKRYAATKGRDLPLRSSKPVPGKGW